jgi:hypothetical protein
VGSSVVVMGPYFSSYSFLLSFSSLLHTLWAWFGQPFFPLFFLPFLILSFSTSIRQSIAPIEPTLFPPFLPSPPLLGLSWALALPYPPFYSGLVGPVSFTWFFSSVFKPF